MTVAAGARVKEAIILDRAEIQVHSYPIHKDLANYTVVCTWSHDLSLPPSHPGAQLCPPLHHWLGLHPGGVVKS